MTYAKGSKILAADYNNFVGQPGGTNSNKALVPFASSLDAQEKVAALYGVGYGDRGYGQSAISLPNVAIDQKIGSAEWKALRDAIVAVAAHQNTDVSQLPPASLLDVGDKVQAHESSSPTYDTYDINSAISAIDANRLMRAGATFTISTKSDITRSTTWSSTIDCTFDLAFGSEDAARFFFNTGGTIRIALSHPDTSTSQDSNWNAILSDLGYIILSAKTTTRTGTGGTPQNIGYYDLTTSFQRIFDGTNIGTSYYSANDVYVDAHYLGGTTNGARGHTVRIRVTLQDQHTNTYYDQVQAGTTASTSVSIPSGTVSGIVNPTFSVYNGF